MIDCAVQRGWIAEMLLGLANGEEWDIPTLCMLFRHGEDALRVETGLLVHDPEDCLLDTFVGGALQRRLAPCGVAVEHELVRVPADWGTEDDRIKLREMYEQGRLCEHPAAEEWRHIFAVDIDGVEHLIVRKRGEAPSVITQGSLDWMIAMNGPTGVVAQKMRVWAKKMRLAHVEAC